MRRLVTIQTVFVACVTSLYVHASPVAADPGTCCPPVAPRQNSIPVHYVTGTHYEVGYSLGRTFGSMIKEFVSSYEPLQKELLPLYELPEGRNIYEESLSATNRYFPQYVIELKGMADGSGVPFHELFLMVLDDTLSKNANGSSMDKGPVGCTSLIMNQPRAQLLGHTEDALSETVNNYYIVAAHVVPGVAEMGGVFGAREEKFEALAYAGHLPGYASGHNYHGLVFSINTIFVSQPLRGRIPREFITRALLSSSSNMDEIIDILTNVGAGTADGFNVNLAFLDVPRESRVFHTIEVTPNAESDRSDVYVTDVKMGNNALHTNRLLYLKYPELNEGGYGSSVSRESRYSRLTTDKEATTVQDMLRILGNKDDDPWPIFSDKSSARVSTINLGVFDFDSQTWTMWTNDPIDNPPLLRLPLNFADLTSPVESNSVVAVNDRFDVIGSLYPVDS